MPAMNTGMIGKPPCILAGAACSYGVHMLSLMAVTRRAGMRKTRSLSFPRALWECRQGALRRESRSVSGVYRSQRVLHSKFLNLIAVT
jgi:hypothetical protein